MLNSPALILDQLAAGQLSAQDALRQLTPARPAADLQGRWLHIRLTRISTGAGKVSVNLPLTWVDLGLRLGAIHQPELAGIDWAEVADLIQSGADGRLVEVEDLTRDERVEISVE